MVVVINGRRPIRAADHRPVPHTRPPHRKVSLAIPVVIAWHGNVACNAPHCFVESVSKYFVGKRVFLSRCFVGWERGCQRIRSLDHGVKRSGAGAGERLLSARGFYCIVLRRWEEMEMARRAGWEAEPEV